MTAYVVRPIGIADVRSGCGKVRLKTQRSPGNYSISRKSYRITVRTDSGITGQYHSSPFRAVGIQVMKVVQRPQRIQAFKAGTFALLPIYPPKIDSVPFVRVHQHVEIVAARPFVHEIERHSFAVRNARPLCHFGVLRFKTSDSAVGMQVQPYHQAPFMHFVQKFSIIGEKFAVPSISRPTALKQIRPCQAIIAEAFFYVRPMPIHIHHKHRKRYVARSEIVH